MDKSTKLDFCYNKGCNKKFDPEDNPDDVCQYHPGAPIFHDAYKGWSCCKKRSTDFTEFLNMPGCARGPHSNVKPVEPEKPKIDESLDQEVITTVEARKPVARLERPTEDEPMISIKPFVAASLKSVLEKKLEELKLTSSNDVPDGVGGIAYNAPCKNNTCKAVYKGEYSNDEECVHHSGSPIFHEGCKYWSCCNQKTSDFTSFLNQPGCSIGKHSWQKKEDIQRAKVKCRYDWFQTGSTVTISLYAKAAVPELCSLDVNRVSAKLQIKFEGGQCCYENHFILNGIIDPAGCNFKLMGSKVEINLKKAEPHSWSSLEMPKAANLKELAVEGDDDDLPLDIASAISD